MDHTATPVLCAPKQMPQKPAKETDQTHSGQIHQEGIEPTNPPQLHQPEPGAKLLMGEQHHNSSRRNPQHHIGRAF